MSAYDNLVELIHEARFRGECAADTATTIVSAGWIHTDELDQLREAAAQQTKTLAKVRAELAEARAANAADAAREAAKVQAAKLLADAGLTPADLTGGA